MRAGEAAGCGCGQANTLRPKLGNAAMKPAALREQVTLVDAVTFALGHIKASSGAAFGRADFEDALATGHARGARFSCRGTSLRSKSSRTRLACCGGIFHLCRALRPDAHKSPGRAPEQTLSGKRRAFFRPRTSVGKMSLGPLEHKLTAMQRPVLQTAAAPRQPIPLATSAALPIQTQTAACGLRQARR